MTDTYTLTEAQLRNSSHEHLVQFCLGLMRTANLHIHAAEQITEMLDRTFTESGRWPG